MLQVDPRQKLINAKCEKKRTISAHRHTLSPPLYFGSLSFPLRFVDALPIESVISMSPATVGLQYSREASRGQVVLLPAGPTALGK